MVFNSLPFLVFISVFIPVFFLTRGRLRLVVCLLASYLFYGWWDWRFLGLIVVSTVVDFGVALLLERTRVLRSRRLLLLASLVTNLGILGAFKYCDFFLGSAYALLARMGLDAPEVFLRVTLPVGISFYTFQTLSYSIDVYRGQIEVERSLLRFAVFVAFFPQLVAGPIVRASALLPQLRADPVVEWDRVTSGAGQVLWGFFKKIAIADVVAVVAGLCFAEPLEHSPLTVLIGVLFYGVQIYCDFSGYSDIAIGLGRVLGYDFGQNFDRPYFSASFSEFWTRWHISLSSWLRDYLYIPLGGNRHGAGATYRNLAITMLLGGLWHGASWTFVLWGALHGLYLILQRLTQRPLRSLAETLRLPQGVRHCMAVAVVFSATTLAWVFFRAASLSDALTIIRHIATIDGIGLAGVEHKLWVFQGAAASLILFVAEGLSFRVRLAELILEEPWIRLLVAAMLLWGIALLGSFGGERFIYFQF